MKTSRLMLVLIVAMMFVKAQGQTCPPLTAGCLDPTFGSGGKVAIPVPTPSATKDIAIQSDAKVVVLFGGEDWGVMRINADGSLDTSFANNGRFFNTWSFTNKNFIYHASASFIALQNVNGEERILIAGLTPLLDGNRLLGAGLRVDRYLPNGSLDTSFGNNGSTILDAGSAGGIAVQPSDQKIITGGASFGPLVRLNANGTLDTSFGLGGKIDAGAVRVLALDTNERILVVDWVTVGKGKNEKRVSTVKRFLSSGTLDTSFGTNGTATISYTQAFTARSLERDVFGNIVVGGSLGSSSTNDADFGVARLTSNGLLDLSFNGSGKAVGGFASVSGSSSIATVQANGRIVLIGNVTLPGSLHDIGVVRFNYDGSLDNSFGNAGRLTLDFVGNDYVDKGGAIQIDPGCGCEKIIVAAAATGYVTFARLNGF